MTKATPRSGKLYFGIGLLILAAFALRVFDLGSKDIWWDEARNIFVASGPLQLIASAKELDIHPPLYFYLQHFWIMLAGTSEFAVRFFSLWFGVSTVAIAFRLGTFIKDYYVGWWAAYLVVISPFFIAEAQQTRMYTLLLFLSSLSVYLLLRAVNTQRREFWIGYSLASAASLYVHYSFVYVLAAQNLFLVLEWLKRWRGGKLAQSFFRQWTGSQIAIALLFLLQVPNILRQMQIYGNPGMTPPSLVQYLLDLVSAFLVGQDTEPNNTVLAGTAIVAALALGIAAVWFQRKDTLTRRNGAMLLVWLLVPLVVFFGVLQKSPQFTPRYVMVAAFPFYLLLAGFWGKLSRLKIALGGAAAVLLLGASAVSLQSLYFNPTFFNDDTRGLARFISENATKDDIVFIDVPFPFSYYYHGVAPAQYLFVDIHTTADVFTQMTQNKKRLFWVSWYKSDTDPRGYVTFLLDKYAIYEGDKEFRGYNVVWYRLPKVPAFTLALSPQPVAGLFGDQIGLTSFAFGGAVTPKTPDADAPRVATGSKAWVALWWQVVKTAREDYKVSIQMRDAKGNLAAQDDRMLINDRHLKSRFWTTDETAINVYTLELLEGVPADEYDLYVIVYDPVSGFRLPIGATDSYALGKLRVVP